MTTNTNEQLDAIQSMMASGHRSVRMERHSLLLWGLGIAFLIIFTDKIFTFERLPPVTWQQITVIHVFIAGVLAVIGIFDFRLTLHARRRRDETLSFVQRQVTKVWWLLAAIIVLVNLGMNIFGGMPLFYGMLLGLIGLALYVQGLFSQQMLSWIGILMIVMGLVLVILGMPRVIQEWFAAAVFGLGFPFLAFMLNQTKSEQALGRRFMVTAGWLFVVCVPAFLAYQWDLHNVIPAVSELELSQYRTQTTASTDTQVVRLPVGLTVPINVELTGDIVEKNHTTVIPLKLSEAVDIAIKNNKPDGRFRIGEGEWRKHIYNLHAQVTALKTTLDPEHGPQVFLKVDLDVD